MATKARLIDMLQANFSLECYTCHGAEVQAAKREDRNPDQRVGDLSDSGNNLSKAQASARASAHLRKHPGHELHWTALGSAGGQ